AREYSRVDAPLTLSLLVSVTVCIISVGAEDVEEDAGAEDVEKDARVEELFEFNTSSAEYSFMVD
ncbi:unnamed protein product, partial [Adineta ricciae]